MYMAREPLFCSGNSLLLILFTLIPACFFLICYFHVKNPEWNLFPFSYLVQSIETSSKGLLIISLAVNLGDNANPWWSYSECSCSAKASHCMAIWNISLKSKRTSSCFWISSGPRMELSFSLSWMQLFLLIERESAWIRTCNAAMTDCTAYVLKALKLFKNRQRKFFSPVRPSQMHMHSARAVISYVFVCWHFYLLGQITVQTK